MGACDDMLNTLKRIEAILYKIDKTNISVSNISNIYSFNTAETSKIKIKPSDVLNTGENVPVTGMYILDVGGGFTYRVNSNTYDITARDAQRIYDEYITEIEITPSGAVGTAYIRFTGEV